MRTAKEIINEFKAIADNPRKAMDDYKKETGKGAVGIMPVYCPEEIVHAAGYLPIGMWGAQKKQISKARTYLPPFACSIMQSVMELQLEGVYDDLEAVIFSVPCDTLKCMSQKWNLLSYLHILRTVRLQRMQQMYLLVKSSISLKRNWKTSLMFIFPIKQSKTVLQFTMKTEQLAVNSLM